MQIHNGIEIIDLCLFLVKPKTLVIPDVHIGYEEALNKQGILIPRIQFEEIMSSLEKIIGKITKKFRKINSIIIIGDLKHEFGAISETEWRQTLRFLGYLSKYTKKIILLRGNHDAILGPIARKRSLEIAENYVVEDILLVHGHKVPKINKNIKTIIIGHEHCAVSLKQGPRVEKFKCFLKGKYKPTGKSRIKGKLIQENPKNLIAMPSFNPLVEGTDVTKEQLLSPFLKDADISNFKVFIVADKVYDFGKIKGLI